MLHVHELLLLMALLGTLVAHHRCSARSRAGEPGGARDSRHLPRVLAIPVARGGRVHRDLRIGWDSHEGTIRWLVCHHLSTHARAHGTHKLRPTLTASKTYMLNVRAHCVMLNRALLWVAGHWLCLRAVWVLVHCTRGRLNRGRREGVLHVVGFVLVRRPLLMVRLHGWMAWSVLRCRALRYSWRAMEMWWKLRLMRVRAVA